MSSRHKRSSWAAVVVLLGGLAVLATPALADHTAPPLSVSVPGSFNSELGCAGDWMPDCPAVDLTYDSGLDRWIGTFALPAGAYEYKVTINDSWEENYGASGFPNGSNIALVLPEPLDVTFNYDPHTHIITHTGPPPPSSVSVPGNFQSELGCPGDWQPDCPVTDLTYDADLDRWIGAFTIPAGTLEFKIAINDSWDENYGAGGVSNGENMVLDLPHDARMEFSYDHGTHLVSLSIHFIELVTAPGSYQSELGCSADWMPDCVGSRLVLDQGQYRFSTKAIPPGDYEFKIAVGGDWGENYGQDGVFGGANIPFTVPTGTWNVTFHWDPVTHVPTVTVETPTSVSRASWGAVKARYR